MTNKSRAISQTYIELRKKFQHDLNLRGFKQFEPILKEARALRVESILDYEKKQLDNLIIDLEVAIELAEAEEKRIENIIDGRKNTVKSNGPCLIEIIKPSAGITIIDPKETGTLLKDCERAAFKHAYDLTNGNQTKMSKILGIAIRTVSNKFKQLRANGEMLPAKGIKL